MKTLLTVLAASALLTACVSQPYTPVVDHAQGQSMTEYRDDLEDCRRLSKERMGATQGAGAGAVAGALLGGIIVAALGGNADSVRQVAGAGAVAGAASGAAAGGQTTAAIVNNCMTGRGYRVL